ncbi:hypothetical protein HC031_30080 [Planosporangium thailandense]|uniref:Uncharacterized protein n=1 Tax=Planosporangium thailandense TaxID=765197 RepID=A0ABX0Y8U1_9ACTN|nr:hypothetical protein [Planosporangium thailandense]NJC73930.1 hypothetical protein [Planosporangium thailandense]
MSNVQTAQAHSATDLSATDISATNLSATGVGARRPALLLAGPVAVVSIGLVFASAARTGGDAVTMATNGLGIASSVAALAALIAMVVGLAGLPAQAPALRHGFGRFAWVVAELGTVLAAGGYWSSVFVQPGLAHVAPGAVRDGITSVTAGFVVSYMVMGLGWALVAIALLRARLIGASGWFLILASLVAISPAPFRYLPLAVAVTVACGLRLGRRRV